MSIDGAVSELREVIRSEIDFGGAITDEELLRKTEEAVLNWCGQNPLPAAEKVNLVRRIYHSFRGLDVLQPLMDDPSVTEIMINSHEDIFVERNGEMERHSVRFESRERLEDLIQHVVAEVNRVVNMSSPIVDARLRDGSRIHVVLPPIALKGPCLTIRKFSDQPITLERLVQLGALSQEAADFLRVLVEAKYNIFISGGTGTGKTTFLGALSRYIPADERVVTIEDSAELQIRTVPNLVSLETRNANTEGKGKIGIDDLIRASLRMRPNRIIIGEVRGAEAFDLLQALNTGHDGSISTGHANSAKDMMLRLESMVMGGAELPLPVIRAQIASALDIVVHLSRFRDKTRKVAEICEVCGVQEGEIRLKRLYHFEEEGERNGKVIGGLKATGETLSNTDKLLLAGKGQYVKG
ncbi:pilus assembly protein [Paenibacillus oryzae]|uniref:Pilus assembly protein n=1 Tax=Paenibacillus oryzae TaxID=1844972 RepID=A0A1A5YLT7_9BACL|nr:CpaF family protein [Paenibacillus oryzae]OBR66345.1 pilus assembly protein [Paenibacillus oryzae]